MKFASLLLPLALLAMAQPTLGSEMDSASLRASYDEAEKQAPRVLSSKGKGKGKGKKDKSPYVGLWECPDQNDGSKVSVSVIKKDDKYQIRIIDTDFVTCPGLGFIISDASIDDDGALVPDQGLSLKCFESGEVKPLPPDIIFTYDYYNDIVEFFFNFDIVCHRVSAKLY